MSRLLLVLYVVVFHFSVDASAQETTKKILLKDDKISLEIPAEKDEQSFLHYSGLYLKTADAIREACEGVAHHKLRPYGSNPKIEYVTVAGQPACYIFPSSDQADGNVAGAVIKYPSAIQVPTSNGESMTVNYFMFDVDQTYMRTILPTLKFLE